MWREDTQSANVDEFSGVWCSAAEVRRWVRAKSWSNREAPGATSGAGYSMMLSEIRRSSVSEMRQW